MGPTLPREGFKASQSRRLGSASDPGNHWAATPAVLLGLDCGDKTLVHVLDGATGDSWLQRYDGSCAPPGRARIAASPQRWTCALMESSWSSMQRDLLDRSTWTTRAELASAIFEEIEAFSNPARRHSGIGYQTPVELEDLHNAALTAA